MPTINSNSSPNIGSLSTILVGILLCIQLSTADPLCPMDDLHTLHSFSYVFISALVIVGVFEIASKSEMEGANAIIIAVLLGLSTGVLLEF